jgi:hypothetical protein
VQNHRYRQGSLGLLLLGNAVEAATDPPEFWRMLMSHEDDKTGILPVPYVYMKPCCLLSRPAGASLTGLATGTAQS